MRAYLARVDAVLIQAVIAAALSFAHLHDLASAAGQSGWKAWAYPVSVDLLLVAAWRRLRDGRDKGAGWCWFLIDPSFSCSHRGTAAWRVGPRAPGEATQAALCVS